MRFEVYATELKKGNKIISKLDDNCEIIHKIKCVTHSYYSNGTKILCELCDGTFVTFYDNDRVEIELL